MHIIRIRIIGNLETTLAVCRKQRQRLEVDIAHYAVVSHHIIELVTVFCVFADKSYKVKVTAAAVVFIAVIKHLNRQILKFFVVKLYKLMSALKHLIVAFKLSHTDCGKHIGHITLVLSVNNIIFPRCDFVFLICVLGLTVKREKHILLVHFFLVNSVM